MSNDRSLPTEASRSLQVGALTFEYCVMPLGAYVSDGLLLALGHFAQELGLPAALRRHVHIKQKRIRYAPEDKLLTFFVSLVDGCGYTCDIDTRLRPYPELARAWDLREFASQSGVNDTLHLLKWTHVRQIEQLFQELFEHHSLARQQPAQTVLVVDIDTKGLPVSPGSQRFEWAERGYFPDGRNQKGLQFSAAFIGGPVREVLGGHLAPGYAHVTHGLPAILQLVEQRLGTPPRRGDLLREHARLVQAEAQALNERAARAEKQIAERYVHVHTLARRRRTQQAQIKALTARCRRLPKRARKLKRQIAQHQATLRLDRRREKKDRQQIERLRQRAARAHQAADLRRAESHGMLELAETSIALGQVRLLLIRSDSALGSGETIAWLLERGYLFVVKGRDRRTARHLAAALAPAAWQRVHSHLRAAESETTAITGCPFAVRLVVCEQLSERGQARYYFLVSNLPRSTYGTVALVEFYNERQTIEAFNKVMGNVLFLDHLRTGSITANEAVAQLSMLAYDLQSWAAHRFFAGTPYQGIAIREFVQKGLRVVARVRWPEPNRCRIEFSLDSPYACAFVAGTQPANGQLPLPIDFSTAASLSKTA